MSNNYQVQGSRIETASKENLAAMSISYEQLKENPLYERTLNCLRDIGQRSSLSVSQVAIMWALQKSFVTSVILSVSNIKELEEDMSILSGGLKLSQEDVYSIK